MSDKLNYISVLADVRKEFASQDKTQKELAAIAKERYDAMKKQKDENSEMKEDKPITFKSMDELKKFVQEAVKEMGSNDGSKDDSDADNWLSTPAIFFTYQHSHTLFSYRKNGKVYHSPTYKRGEEGSEGIRFEHSYRYPIGSRGSRDSRMVTLSVHKTHRKDVADFIRKSPMFEVQYFEDIRNANVDDALQQQVMVDIANGVRGMSTHALVERAKSLPNVVITQDIDNLRLQVIRELTRMQVEQSKARNRKIVEATQEEAKKYPQAVNRVY